MNDRSDSDQQSDERAGNGPSLFLILMLVLAGLTAAFVVQNSDRGTIRFLFFEGEFRVWTAILVAVLLGALLDRVVQIWWRRARRDRDD